MDLCDNCIEKDFHTQHKRFIHKFYMHPGIASPTVYCDSCGYVFPENPLTYVWQCETCQDYCLCKKCKNESMHDVHRKQFRVMMLEKYKKSVY